MLSRNRGLPHFESSDGWMPKNAHVRKRHERADGTRAHQTDTVFLGGVAEVHQRGGKVQPRAHQFFEVLPIHWHTVYYTLLRSRQWS